MSQHDLNIANQGFPAFRADLNDALVALGSTNSGATAPATTYANQLWYDTANNILKIRNEDNDAWISIATLDQSGDLVSAITATTLNGTTVNAGALNATGVTTVQAGTVSLPAITTSGDTNTGIFFPAADTIAFTEGGVESMRIDSSGNLAIGLSAASTKLDVNGIGRFRRAVESAQYTEINTQGGESFIDGVNGTSGTVQQMAFRTGNNASTTERMRIDASGNVSIGGTSLGGKFEVFQSTTPSYFRHGNGTYLNITTGAANGNVDIKFDASSGGYPAGTFWTGGSERMRINDEGFVLIGKSTNTFATQGTSLYANGEVNIVRDADVPLYIRRNTTDGVLIDFYQDGSSEGNISVSGSTVSYNGGHLSRWSQLPDGSKDDAILKGTVMSNLDDMCVWEKDGVVDANEQLNKMKVSDVEGDTNVAGVFVNWTMDEDYGVDDMNVAMTGDMIIRIADGVVVQKGDLLMSAGDGTAKPQGDDIVRSKTIAKVTSNYVTCTYADGSYCVPCVLMAC
jgi:hypothetical protein